MSFDSQQQALNRIAAEIAATEAALRCDRADLARAERAQTELGRIPDRAEAARLHALIARHRAAINEQRVTLTDARRRQSELLHSFVKLPPQEAIANLSDRTPICLFPLRLETRFKPAVETGAAQDALWLRVFPDDISIDSFEDELSETEARSARAYWAAMWAAGGADGLERAAWAGLMKGQGAGRSYWVTQAYAPLNPGDKPAPPATGPWLILAITMREDLPATERAALQTFWRASWLAGDDLAAQQDARTALSIALGDTRAAELVAGFVPMNFADPPPAGSARDEVQVTVALLQFPSDEVAALRVQEWATTPRARLLPDQLVFMGFQGDRIVIEQLGAPIPGDLAVGPDPLAEDDAQTRPDGADIKMGDGLEWLRDFDRAVEVGMGFRIPLAPEQMRQGFDQILVLGLRLKADAGTGAQELGQLLQNHHRSKAGLSVLPQGCPTNNVETEGAAYSWREDPDISFEHYFGTPAGDPSGWFTRTDGRWLAEMLGIDPALLRSVPFYGRTDISDARAMNVALWPGTLGYFCASMLHPALDEDTIRQLRSFFTGHVSARGMIPAIRIGRQPYGILPVSPRSRLGWFNPRHEALASISGSGFLPALYRMLRQVEGDLQPLLERVAHIGKPTTDSQQMLLDIVGLHPGSAEFQQRFAESFAQLFNRLRMQAAGADFIALMQAADYVVRGIFVMQRLGYAPDPDDKTPAILEKFFTRTPFALNGPLIDDVPLSETASVRAYAQDGRNYLAWLRDAAATSHEALRMQEGFANGRPNALLYHMLRHALDLGYVETSLRLYMNAGLLTAQGARASYREAEFMQVGETDTTGSRWQQLYARELAVTGSPNVRVGDFIPTVMHTMTATAELSQQLAALDHLRERPTAALERCLAEHIDLLTYRLDAWYGGLNSVQLSRMRYPEGTDDAQAAQGVYLGAWGWLEDVRPEPGRRQPVRLTDEALRDAFDEPAAPHLMRDSRNQGFIHAPSANHAVTAAVLRNGYLSNATPANPDSLAVNLTSERVRMALSIVEGMQADQSLAALLGYQFERGLHDRHDVEVDAFIYDLRKAFPLTGDRLRPTRTAGIISIRQVEARNVIDGLEFVQHLKTHSQDYPFGLSSLPPATPAQAAAIGVEARRLLDIADAVADLAMAESVHQVVQGNYERAGAVMDTYSKGKSPSTPEVVMTPRKGVNLTHRFALHLRTGMNPADPARLSARARAEPALDDWLGDVLPDLARIAVRVQVLDPAGAVVGDHIIALDALGLAPLDLIYLIDPEDRQSGKALDDLIEARVIALATPRPDQHLSLGYRERLAAVAGHIPVFELAALIRALRKMLLEARTLRPTDMALAQEAAQGQDLEVTLDPQRVTLGHAAMAACRDSLRAFADAIEPLVAAEPPDLAAIAAGIDTRITEFTDAMLRAQPFAPAETGTGVIFADRGRIFTMLLEKLDARIQRLDARLADFDAAIAAYDADPTLSIPARIEALILAERSLRTTDTDPVPSDPVAYRALLLGTHRPAFLAERDALAAIGPAQATLSGLDAAIAARIASLAQIDPEPLDLMVEHTQILTLAADMARRARSLSDALGGRLLAVDALVASALTQADPRRVVEDRTSALRLIFGEEFQVVPEFTLPAAQAAEWQQAWGPGAAADQSILDYQKTVLNRPFPVDDFMMGLARVRERLGLLEGVTRLAESFETAAPDLQVLQFPYRADLPWLGLEFPDTLPDGTPLEITEDKLLYTAHFAEAFDGSRPQAGLLIDDLTETIPARDEDSGLAFHYDRPNSEPPQTLLLCLPAEFTGEWQWRDLVDCVRETMDLARKRAIEPDQIDTTPYGRFLPAIISAVTLYPLTAALNYAEINGVSAALQKIMGGVDE